MSMHLLFGLVVGFFFQLVSIYTKLHTKKFNLLLIAPWHFILAIMSENYFSLLKVYVYCTFIYFKSISSNVMWYKVLQFINNTKDGEVFNICLRKIEIHLTD